MSTNVVSRRLIKEWKDIVSDEEKLSQEGIKIEQINDRVDYLNVTINGAKDTPYEGGIFELRMLLTNSYPMDPPKIFFQTKIFHPNIDDRGKICLDILKDKWTPAINIVKVVISILALMSEPNPSDPLNNKAADLWINDKEEAIRIAKEYVMLYASPNLELKID